MLFRLLADATLIIHLAFIVFVVLGGLLVFRWPRIRWFHLPTVIYGALIEFIGWVCPLTPLEKHFRRLAGQNGYEGGFVEHYLVAIIYPSGLTKELQIALGVAVVVINVVIYAAYYLRRKD